MASNYYVILGVGSDASQEEIKRAYRQHAKATHPDTSGGESQSFLEVQDAYSVLGDPQQREQYDRKLQRRRRPSSAESIYAGRRQAEPFRPADTRVRMPDISLFQSFETFQPTLEEMLHRVVSNFTSAPVPKSERNESCVVEIPLSHEEAWLGASLRLLIPAQAQCPSCRGHGVIGFYTCWRCHGQGLYVADYPVILSVPPGTIQSHTVEIPLEDLGISNLHLVVHFRVTDSA